MLGLLGMKEARIEHHANQKNRREIVFDYGFVLYANPLILLPENIQQDQCRGQRAGLHNPEHPRFSPVKEEIQKIKVCIASQKDRSRIPHQSGSSLKIGGYGYRNDAGNRRNF